MNPQKMLTQSKEVIRSPRIGPPNGSDAKAGRGIKPNNLAVMMDPPDTRTATIIRPANKNPAPGPATEMKICSFGPRATFAQRLPHSVDSGTVSPPAKCRIIWEDNP